MAAISIKNLHFAYRASDPLLLNIHDFTIAPGEKVFLFGPSGSGKSSLLGLITGILTPLSGEVLVLDKSLSRLSAAERDHLRGSKMGYVFQLFNLLPSLTALDNILLPLRLHPERKTRIEGDEKEAAHQISRRLKIDNLLQKSVLELSIGQQQRVAVARALLGRPEVLVCDEPTSALDTDHRLQFLDLLFEQCRETKSTLLFVSHDRSLGAKFDRQVSLPEINRAPHTPQENL